MPIRVASALARANPAGRLNAWPTRGRVMLTEIFGHTRMLKWSVVGAAHWFVERVLLTLAGVALALAAAWVVPKVARRVG